MTFPYLRIARVSGLAVVLGAIMAAAAQFLLWLIEFITSIAFFGRLGVASPAENHLGLAVVLVPVVGGLLVGLMAKFGSPAIRGHGIPEAMQQALENSSRIPARLTLLKPLSAAISIGTGGPFGAEGPIIATGGAGGSLLGQILPVSAVERRTLLAAGAAAGMAATFGSPLSAILLAVELLLFEFNARSLIPVALAVSVATVLRAGWIGSAPVFPMPAVAAPTILAFGACLLVAALMGLAAFGISRAVYFIEDLFEKLPVHWMWWPAIGGVVVGGVGYLAPHTLGVGYDNITSNLAGNGALIAILCFSGLKFLSWSVALGSGTSGGTLAPLMTIGSALGWVAGVALQAFIPGLDPHLVALVGMACVFSGASQALLASAVFAYETTGQVEALFTLLACSAVSVLVVRALGRTSIMTEKIERRGVRVPSQFSADVFEHASVASVMDEKPVTVDAHMPLVELARKIAASDPALGPRQAHPVLDQNGELVGIVTRGDVIRAIEGASEDTVVADCATMQLVTVCAQDTLHAAIHKLLVHDIGRLPVVADDNPRRLVGYLDRRGILSAKWKGIREETPGPACWP